MTDFWSVENAFFTMILLVVMGVVLALVIAPNVDQIIMTLRGMGFDSGAGTAWDTTGAFWTIHNILVVMLYSPAPLGMLIFLVSVSKRSRRDDYNSGYESGNIYGIEE
jgi:hypothetical protein